MEAVRKNEYEKVVHFLARQRGCINLQEPDTGLTALHVAAGDGNLPTVKLLLTHRASANLTDRQGDSPLHYACYKGHTPVIRLLVNTGAEINNENKRGFTPIFLSSWKGFLEATRLLLDVGAKVDGKRTAKSTPLLAACKAGHYDVVSLLLERKAWVDARPGTNNEITPLHVTAQAGHRDLIAVARLVCWFKMGLTCTKKMHSVQRRWKPPFNADFIHSLNLFTR